MAGSALAAAFALAVGPASAQDRLYWDGEAAGNAANGVVDGGNGVWSGSAVNWTNASGVAQGTANLSGALVFEGSAGTVTLSGYVEAGGLDFRTDGYILTGDTLTLSTGDGPEAGPAGVRVGSDGDGPFTTTLNMALSTGGITKTGAGTLILAGANNHSQLVTASEGELRLTNSNSGNALVEDGAILSLFDGVGGASGSVSGAIEINDGGKLLIDKAGFTSLSDIRGLGDLEKRGAGTTTVSGGSFGGVATVFAGTLAVSSQNAFAQTAVDLASSGAVFSTAATGFPGSTNIGGLSGVAGSRVLINEKGLRAVSDADTTFAGTLEATNGATTFTKAGTGTLTLIADQLGFDGNLIVSDGVLAFGGDASAANSRIDLQSVGKFDISGLGGLSTRVLGIAGSSDSRITLGDKRLEIAGSTSQYDGQIEGAGGVDLIGAELILRNAHTFTGGMTVDGASLLRLVDTVSLASAVTVDGVLRVEVDSLDPVTASIGGLNGAGEVVLFGDMTLTGGGVFAGDLADDAALGNTAVGTVTITGGEQVVTGEFRHTGGTILAGGDLTIGDGGATGWVQGDIDVGAGSTLTFDRSDDITYADILSGIGDIVQQGDGMLTLTGQNTFSGVLTVRDGILALGAGGDISTATLVLDGGLLDLSLGGAATIEVEDLTGQAGSTFALGQANLTVQNGQYGGVISGEGGLSVAGLLGLSGANTYQGGTTILSGGRIDLSGTGQLGSGPVTIAGTLDISNRTAGFAIGQLNGAGRVILGSNSLSVGGSQNSAFSGIISGAGGFTKVGTGEVTLTGLNTYTGGTTVLGGTLIGNVGSIRGDVNNAGRVVFNQTTAGVFAGNLSGLGAFVKTGAGVLDLTGSSGSSWSILNGGLQSQTSRFSGDAAIGAGASLTFLQEAAGVYARRLSGAGTFEVLGGGDITLTGNSSGFSGSTIVGVGGILSVNGSLGGRLDVLAGGRLEGVGAVGATSVTGAIAPGNSIGVLTVDGAFTFGADGVYEVEFNDEGEGDLIVVTGAATIEGGLVKGLGSGTAFAPSTTYTILTAAGGVTGEFDDVTSDLAFLTPTLSYSAKAVTLKLERNQVEFESIARTRNQRAVAVATQDLSDGNGVFDAVLRLSETDARGAFDQLSGGDYASVRGSLSRDSRFLREAVLARGSVAAQAGDGVWVEVTGSRARTDSDGNAAGHRRDAYGVMGGVDKAVSDTLRIGAVVGQVQDDIRFNGGAAQHDVETSSLGGYAVLGSGAATLTVGANQAWHDVDSVRSVVFPGLSETLRGDYDLRTSQVFGEVAGRFDMDGVQVRPFAGVARVRISDGAVTETGGAAALTAKGFKQTTDYLSAGVRVGSDWTVRGMGLSLDASAGARHTLNGRVPLQSLGFGSGVPFTVAGVTQDETVGVVDVGVGLAVTETIRVGVVYSGQFGSNTTDNGAQARLSWRF